MNSVKNNVNELLNKGKSIDIDIDKHKYQDITKEEIEAFNESVTCNEEQKEAFDELNELYLSLGYDADEFKKAFEQFNKSQWSKIKSHIFKRK